jgi:hypothetical protein
VVNFCSDCQLRRRHLCKFIYIFKMLSIIFHFYFYWMLIFFETLGANCIGLKDIIVRRQGCTNISVYPYYITVIIIQKGGIVMNLKF